MWRFIALTAYQTWHRRSSRLFPSNLWSVSISISSNSCVQSLFMRLNGFKIYSSCDFCHVSSFASNLFAFFRSLAEMNFYGIDTQLSETYALWMSIAFEWQINCTAVSSSHVRCESSRERERICHTQGRHFSCISVWMACFRYWLSTNRELFVYYATRQCFWGKGRQKKCKLPIIFGAENGK